MKFKRKYSEIEAVQWDGNLETIECLKPFICLKDPIVLIDENLKIFNAEGTIVAIKGEYIVKDNGTLGICSPQFIEQNFEEIKEPGL